MKLYAFDSCPYCVRVRALIGLKGIACQLEFPVAGSLPESLVGKMERLVVPVLEVPGTASQDAVFMRESSLIIRHLDQIDQQPVFDDYEISDKLSLWIDRNRSVLDSLCYPRMRLLSLPELGSVQAMQYFESSREQHLGMPLLQALNETERFILALEEALAELAELLDIEGYLKETRPLNIGDIYTFPELRNLSMIEELELPTDLRDYLNNLSLRTQLPLYKPVSRFCFENVRL